MNSVNLDSDPDQSLEIWAKPIQNKQYSITTRWENYINLDKNKKKLTKNEQKTKTGA